MTLIQSVTVEGGRPGPELVCSLSPKPVVTYIRQVMCSRRLEARGRDAADVCYPP